MGITEIQLRTVAAGEARILGWHAVPTLPETGGKGEPGYVAVRRVQRLMQVGIALRAILEESRQLGWHAVPTLPETGGERTRCS